METTSDPAEQEKLNLDLRTSTATKELGHFKLIDWNATLTQFFTGSVLTGDIPWSGTLIDSNWRVRHTSLVYHEICNGHFLLDYICG